MELACGVLHGHFGPVYLLQVSKNVDEKRCFFEIILLYLQSHTTDNQGSLGMKIQFEC